MHVKREPRRFSTDPAHIASEKISRVERGAGWLLKRAVLIGDHTGRWAKAVLEARGIQGVRVLHGLRHYVEHGVPSPRTQRQLDRLVRASHHEHRADGCSGPCQRLRRHASCPRPAIVSAT